MDEMLRRRLRAELLEVGFL
ncbi:DUF7364 domain-containing protein, partial [Pseudomonas aeruginosa]